MPMRIMITGAQGQLGTALEDVLKNGRSEIGILDGRYGGCEVMGLDIPDGDIACFDVIHRHTLSFRPNVIIHCAAMTAVDDCESDPQTAMRVNVIGTRNVAISAQVSDAKMLYVSTDYVFSGQGDSPYKEWDTPNPQTVYGRSKWLGENVAAQHCAKLFTVRTAWLYSYRGKNFIKTILELAREKGEVQVVDDQYGNPTHAYDLAHHLLLLALTEEYGLYHCTNEGICTWYDVAKAAVERYGIPCDVRACTTEAFVRPAPRPTYSALDNLMLQCTVGNHMRPWQEALNGYIDHLKGEKEF